MLAPQLRQAASTGQHRLGSHPRLYYTRTIAIASSTSVTTQQTRSWSWTRRGRHCDPQLTPESQAPATRHSRPTKADLRHAVRLCRQWDRPARFLRLLGARNASHWSKSGKRWQQFGISAGKPTQAQSAEDEHELSEGEKRWKRRMVAMKERIDQDPYRAVFGKPFDPFWSNSIWGPLVPAFMKPENAKSNISAEAHNSQSDVPNSSLDRAKSHSRQDIQPYAETSSYTVQASQKHGEKPNVEATATSWNSDTNNTRHLKYDPITNRMVPVEAQQSKEPLPDKSSVDIPVKTFQKSQTTNQQVPQESTTTDNSFSSPYPRPASLSRLPKDDIDFMTADKIRASMGKTKGSEPLDQVKKEQQSAALERDFYAKTDALPKDLEQTRQALAAMRSRSQASKLDARNILQPEAPKSIPLQSAMDRVYDGQSTRERRAWRDITKRLRVLRVIIEEEVDFQSDEGTPSATLLADRSHIESLKERTDGVLSDLELTTASKHKQAAVQGERLDILRNVVRLEKAWGINRPQPSDQSPPHDGYSTLPMGMQNTFNKEVQACQTGERLPLEQQLGEQEKISADAAKGIVLDYDDGYGNVPIGLQTSYVKERESCAKGHQEALEKQLDLKEMQSRDLEVDDGYGKAPIGLQTSYQKEREECAKGKQDALENELKLEAMQTRDLEVDDGYGMAPIGLQMSYKQEREACEKGKMEPLEQELKPERRMKEGLEFDDGYVGSPVGLQNSYTKERAASASGQQLTLEQELNPELQIKQSPEFEDGYAKAPFGLQTSYGQERESSGKHDHQSLEEEYAAKRKAITDAERGISPQYDDGFSNLPIGLQESYGRERQDCAEGSKQSLEKELEPKGRPAQAYKDHSNSSPIGLQILFQQGRDAVKKGERQSLEDQLKVKRLTAANKMLEAEIRSQKQAMFIHEGRLAKPNTLRQSPQPAVQERKTAPVGGEGDVCPNITKYVGSEKWYKQAAWHREQLAVQARQSEQRESDKALVGKIQEICNRHQLFALQSSPETTSEHLVDQAVQKCLAEHDSKLGPTAYKFKDDGLEQDLITSNAAKAVIPEVKARNPTDKLAKSTSTAPSPSATSSLEWETPALYKILAYDSGNDILTTVSTPSRFSEVEVPMPISTALSQLYQPARFVPHFSRLQEEGFHVISASRDLLVFRKTKATKVGSADNADTTTAARKSEATPYSVQASRDAVPLAGNNRINPIDGTSRSQDITIPTGNFASPTGFVNYDSIEPSPSSHSVKQQQPRHEVSTPAATRSQADEIEDGYGHDDINTSWRHYPRVRRQEPVFSGGGRHQGWAQASDTSFSAPTTGSRRDKNARHNSHSGKGYNKEKRGRRWRRRVTFALSVGACTAASVYVIGVGAELARGERK